MASDGNPVKIPAASLVHGSQAHIPVNVQRGGTSLPHPGKSAAAPAVRQVPGKGSGTTTEELLAELNKHINVSGRADQYRVDPGSNGKVIQQINPATGDVLGEFLVSEFPALARSLGITRGGTFVDERA